MQAIKQIMIHRKTRLLFWVFPFILFTACENLLHEEEISIGKIESYEQLLDAAGGVYSRLNGTFFGQYYLYFHSANLKGDDLSGLAKYYTWYKFVNCNSGGSSSSDDYPERKYYLYEQLYQTIASANNIICQYDATEIKDKAIRNVVGEIYLIRAYCHFRLTRTYGRVPLVTDIDIDYNITKPTFEKIYESIADDLKTAMELLPENNASARIPYITPHRGAAKAILAEVYLSWAGYPCNDREKYELAAKEAGEIIDSASYFGIELLPDFAWLWDKEHLYNGESLFSFYTATQETATLEEAWNSMYTGKYGDYAQGHPRLYLSPDLVIAPNFYSTGTTFFNNFPSGYRKDITFYNSIYVPYNLARSDTGYIRFDQVSSCDNPAYRKFYYNAVTKDFPNDYGYVWYFYIGVTRAYIFRYAHTLLTYAEASARSGQPGTKAYEAVNQIRRRARHIEIHTPSAYDLQPGLSAEAFANSVVWERAWELAGEPEGRWFDIVRLDMIKELQDLRDPNEGGPPEVFDESAYFFDIPEEDLDLNPNLGKE